MWTALSFCHREEYSGRNHRHPSCRPGRQFISGNRGCAEGQADGDNSCHAPFSSVLRIGELEIYHEHRRVLMAGREVRLNHGEYVMLYCMASAPGQVFSKAQLYAAAWGEEYLHGETSVENIIWRLRQKLEQDPKHPFYIKTVARSGYKIDGSTK